MSDTITSHRQDLPYKALALQLLRAELLAENDQTSNTEKWSWNKKMLIPLEPNHHPNDMAQANRNQ